MWEKELNFAIEAGKSAIKYILEIYNSNFDVEFKNDNSPVTKADKISDKIIRDYLSKEYPTYSFLTEESFDDLTRLKNDYVWIVDPLDGTQEFITKNNQFTINIALSYKHEIVVGVILVPVTGEIYFASKGNGAYRIKNSVTEKIHVSNKIDNLTVLMSVSHKVREEEIMLKKHSDVIKNSFEVGASLKACLIAEGTADLFYRLSSGTKEWDTAASQCIVEESGGLLVKPNGEPLTYNREDVYNREGFIIANKKENILL